MADIFISYAREDETRIRELVRGLEKQGWSIFWDRRIPAGKTWQSYIGQALSDAQLVIVAWSQHSITSDWVIEEANDAKERGHLVPVLLDSVRPPLGFRGIQAADLTNWKLGDSSPQFDQLIQDIAGVLGDKPHQPTPEEELTPRTQPVAIPKAVPTEPSPHEPTPSEPEPLKTGLPEPGAINGLETITEDGKLPRFREPETIKDEAAEAGKKTPNFLIEGIIALVLVIVVVWALWPSREPSIPETRPVEPPVAETPQVPPKAQEMPKPEVKPPADSLSPATSGDRSAIVPEMIAIGKRMLSNLDKTRNTGPGFDYWPEGGIQIAYYHLATFASYETLVRLSPFPVFASGPHGTRQLKLDSPFAFGHYNPEFLRWFHDHLTEILRSRDFVRSTKQLFKTYLGETAMVYWATYTTLNQHPKELNVLLQDYKTHIDNRTLPEGYYYDLPYMEKNPFVSLKNLYASQDVNLVKPAVYFWLRRHIDGTHQKVFSMLESLLRAYGMI